MTKSTDVRTPGIEALSKKWNIPLRKLETIINKGSEVESEHTKNKEKAREIARDHIAEKPDYYKRLKKAKLEEEDQNIDRVLAAFRKKESGSYEGDYSSDASIKSKGKLSASGAYQFIDKTWQNTTKDVGHGTEYKRAVDAPKEVQDKVMRDYLQKNIDKHGLEGAVNVHYTGNPRGIMKGRALKANAGQNASQYYNDFKKNIDSYQTSSLNEKELTEMDWDSTTKKGGGVSYPKSGPRKKQLYKAHTTRSIHFTKDQGAPGDPGKPRLKSMQDAFDAIKKAYPPGSLKHLRKEETLSEISKEKLCRYLTKVSKQPSYSRENDYYYKNEQGAAAAVSKLDTKSPKWMRAKVMAKEETQIDETNKLNKKRKIDWEKDHGRERIGHVFDPRRMLATHNRKKAAERQKQMQKEENQIAEALNDILNQNYVSMEEKLSFVLQEKVMESLEERKKIIASQYFGQ